MAKLELLVRTILSEPDGLVIRDSGLRPSRSFVFQLMQILAGCMNVADVAGGKDTGGVARTIDASAMAYPYIMHSHGQANDDTIGIVVGSGTTAPTNIDYALATQIAHGVGAGQLQYNLTTFTAPAVVGSNVDYIISRSYTNSSGGSVTVTEVGIYSWGTYTTAQLGKFLTARDLLASAEVVPNGKVLTVQYTLRTTV